MDEPKILRFALTSRHPAAEFGAASSNAGVGELIRKRLSVFVSIVLPKGRRTFHISQRASAPLLLTASS